MSLQTQTPLDTSTTPFSEIVSSWARNNIMAASNDVNEARQIALMLGLIEAEQVGPRTQLKLANPFTAEDIMLPSSMRAGIIG